MSMSQPNLEALRENGLIVHALGLAVPARRNLDDAQAIAGEALFAKLGCASCHIPKMQTGTLPNWPELSNQTIRPFTDLLLHDMGPELADGRPDFQASGSEWRTPPLWGLGLVQPIDGYLFLMHDGRARGFEEAILWHGGQAESSKEAFRTASKSDRDALDRVPQFAVMAMTRALVTALLFVAPACSTTSSAPDAGAGGCQPYVSTANLASPVVSFGGDVVPIFRRSCSVGGDSCHGDPSVTAEQRPFLGYADSDGGTSSLAAIHDAIVGVTSGEDLLMSYVAAGDPAHSFLMHKLDDDQCTLISQCMAGASFRPNCGVFMPYQFPDILDAATRDTVRRWIFQGAQTN